MDILIEELQERLWCVAYADKRIQGIEIDPAHEYVRWGSIYWAKVTRVDAALDAVFLDLDGENEAILYNKDARFESDGRYVKGGATAISKNLSAGDMIAVQAKADQLSPPTQSMGYENKIVRASMDITLQGRYLIYAPYRNTNALSQRIRGKKQRAQLTQMMGQFDSDAGFILRSSATDLQTEILHRETDILQAMWAQISEFFDGTTPALIALGPNAIERLLGDHALDHIHRIDVVTMNHFEIVEEWCEIFAPDLITRITPIELENATEDLALFEYRDITSQIEALARPVTLLKSGGNIIIEETSAMVVIDVNTGTDRRGNLATNLEAAAEIAAQIRLRNLGGTIVIDMINTPKKAEKQLLSAFEDALRHDPCTVQIHGITALGLLEITRNKRTSTLSERCQGVFDL